MALSSSRDRESGLSNLLADVLRPEDSGAELLVRYADDPTSLAPDERERVESELRASPALRDQLRVLQSFDLAAVLAQDSAEPAVARAPAPLPAPGLWARILERVRGRVGLVLVPIAGAALLAFALLRSGAPELAPPGTPAPGPVAKIERPQLPPPAPAPPPMAPEPTPEKPEVVTPPPEPPPSVFAQIPKPAPKPAPTPGPRNPPPPTDLDYVAMAEPLYRTPFGVASTDEGATYVRGPGGGVTLLALAPRHVARTVSARPPLYWYLSALPEGSPRYVLTIASDDEVEPVLQAPLAAPTGPGLQRAEIAVDLPRGKALRWSVAIKLDPENPSQDVIAGGWIERVPEAPELAAKLGAARPLDRASVYAADGIWYDALAELERVARAAPAQAAPRARLRTLLESAGIPEAERLAPQ